MKMDSLLREVLRLEPQRYSAIYDYCWDHYSYFANQRSKILDELKGSLVKKIKSFCFENWSRIVSYKYTLDPLSAKGSVFSIGGRFNIGNIDQMKFSIFPALYVSKTVDTAFKERYGLYSSEKKSSGLTAEEFALGGNDTIIKVSGKINQILDLSESNILYDFFQSIRKIKLPRSFIRRAKCLNIQPMFSVPSLKSLMKTILEPNWRQMPMHFDIPSNSQILGQIAHAAGIEGIVYPSRMSDKDKCIAIYPERFSNSDSFVEIIGEVAPENKNRRLDSNSYIDFL